MHQVRYCVSGEIDTKEITLQSQGNPGTFLLSVDGLNITDRCRNWERDALPSNGEGSKTFKYFWLPYDTFPVSLFFKLFVTAPADEYWV